MTRVGSIAIVNIFLFISFSAFGAGESLNIRAVLDGAGQPLSNPLERQVCTILFQLLDGSGKGIGPQDLQVVHEKLFHNLYFDLGLTNYLHEHPVPEEPPGMWRLSGISFKQAGSYKVWADITLANPHLAAEETSPDNGNRLLLTTVEVKGRTPPNATPKFLEPRSDGVDGISRLTLLGTEALHPGEMAMLTLKWSRTDGTVPIITPYLGAMAHTLITDLTGTHLIHVHPMQMGGEWMLHTEFPAAGDYRLFIQFNDGNPAILRTIEYAVRVR